MKRKGFCKKKQRKVIVIAVSLGVVLLITAGAAIYCFRKGTSGGSFFLEGGKGGFSMTEGAVSGSGVISPGVTQENFQVEDLETKLEIEEVCISSGTEIEAGTKILKLSKDSVEEAREELEKKALEAELAYRAGAIEYEKSKITAEYEYNSAVLSGEQAGEVYAETVAGLKNTVEKANKALQDAREQITEYETYVRDDSYRAYFKVDEYQALYDENLKLLTDRMDEWGVSWSQVTGGNGGQTGETSAQNITVPDMSAGVSTVSSGDGGGSSQSSQYVKVLAALYGVLEQNGKDLEQAQNDYEDAETNARFELQTLELQLPSLEKAVEEARKSYETQLLQAELTYETALANAERAQSEYSTALEKAESDYEDLKHDYEDAKENLALFESSVGDGYYLASGSGSVLRTMVRAGQYLTCGSTVFVYSDPDRMTVTVPVDQSQIAEISVGEPASVMTGTEIYEGIVSQIDPVTASESRTSVTYHVTVSLEGETGELTSNQSVTVVFGTYYAPAEAGRREQADEKNLQ